MNGLRFLLSLEAGEHWGVDHPLFTHTQSDQHTVGESSALSQCMSNYHPLVSQLVEMWRPYTRRPSLVIIAPPTTNENTNVQGLPGLGLQRVALEVELMMNRLTHQLPSRDLTFMWGIERVFLKITDMPSTSENRLWESSTGNSPWLDIDIIRLIKVSRK